VSKEKLELVNGRTWELLGLTCLKLCRRWREVGVHQDAQDKLDRLPQPGGLMGSGCVFCCFHYRFQYSGKGSVCHGHLKAT
jgi:hypothetical protein